MRQMYHSSTGQNMTDTGLTDLSGGVGRDSLLSEEICPLSFPASFLASFPWLTILIITEPAEFKLAD